jgi:hypothetical protein
LHQCEFLCGSPSCLTLPHAVGKLPETDTN